MILLIDISIINAGSKAVNNVTSNNNSGSTSISNQAVTGKIGEAVRDGKFEFTVLSQQCGIASVGSEYLNKTAHQGQCCKINIKVKNIGDTPQSMSSSGQKLFSSDNKEFSSDDTAMIYNNSSSQSVWLNEINPGNEVTGDLIFGIPKDATPAKIELYDSVFSNWVEVKLN